MPVLFWYRSWRQPRLARCKLQAATPIAGGWGRVCRVAGAVVAVTALSLLVYSL